LVVTEDPSEGRSFSAEWVTLDKEPVWGLKIEPTLHLKVQVGKEKFFLVEHEADELAAMISKTSSDAFWCVMRKWHR
jgi:hypothetical protein